MVEKMVKMKDETLFIPIVAEMEFITCPACEKTFTILVVEEMHPDIDGEVEFWYFENVKYCPLCGAINECAIQDEHNISVPMDESAYFDLAEMIMREEQK